MTKCFVIGPIGEVGSSIRADADDFMKYIVAPVVTDEEFDYEAPIRADSLNEPGRITSQIVSLLMEAELVIADLTTNNANVFYELSLRHAIGKPVIHMAAAGTPLSFDVRDNRTIFYTMHSREAEAARDELAKQIRHVRKPGYKAMNPILETVGIVNLENSNIPEKAAIRQLMSMIEGLSYNILDIQHQMRSDALRSNALGAFASTQPIFVSNGTGLLSGIGSQGGVAVSGVGRVGGVAGPAGIISGVTSVGALSGLTTAGIDAAKATPSDKPKPKK
jgi:hypothetical protein